MTSHIQRPTRRRQRGLTAKAIVLGHPATPILHQGRTAHLLPVRGGDHRARYAPGQRLSIKVMVPGPTECHVIVTRVQGPRDAFTLGQLAYLDARELGHTRLDHLWRHWITNHDQAWLGRAIQAGADTEDQIAQRFDARWAGKLAWLIRFRLDHTAQPRLLAASPSIYDPEKEDAEGRDEDRGYTTSDARSLPGEMPALTDTEWATHIGPQSRYRSQDRVAQQRADREARNGPQRLAHARATARAKGYDITREIRLYDAHITKGKQEKALRQLELIEARVFPIAA